MPNKLTAATLALVLTTHGCFAHVALPRAPDRHAALAVRVAAYRRYHAVVDRQPTYAMLDRTRSASLVTLGDGSRVVYPEDLMPMVAPASATARAAALAVSRRSDGRLLEWLAVGAFSLALVPMLVGLATESDPVRAFATNPAVLVLEGLLLGAGLGFSVGMGASFMSAERASAAAFDAYDGSLRERLGLCGEGAQLIDCDDARGPRPPQSTPSPAPAVPSNPN